MISKRIATTCVLAALAVSPAQKVAAGGGDALVGGVIGGIIGGVIVNEVNKNHQRRTYRSTQMSSGQREQNRQTQAALNYFGFPAGVPDGVMGGRSRAAAANYQAFMGYPASGYLNDYEQSFLLTSYQRALAGGPVTMQQAAANPMGPKGLLLAYRDEMAGRPAQGAGMMAAAPQPPATDPFSAPAQTQVMAAIPAPPAPAPVAEAPAPAVVPAAAAPAETAEAPKPALPTFMGGADQAQGSLASHCNKISLVTNSNGGFTKVADMKDPNFALNEQFCLARTYAIAEGEDLASKIKGFTPQQIAAQCEGFGPAMKPQIAALSLQPEAEVIQQTTDFIQKSGMDPAQMEATAKICLSVGYRTDNLDVALGSALLLTALGDRVYAELLGHHLAEGFGVARRPELALAWYQTSLDALANGEKAAFVPGQPERSALIRKAAYAVAGRPEAAATVKASSSLPSFAAPAKD